MVIKKAIEVLRYHMEMCRFNPITGEEIPMSKECEELADACEIAIRVLMEQENIDPIDLCAGCAYLIKDKEDDWYCDDDKKKIKEKICPCNGFTEYRI